MFAYAMRRVLVSVPILIIATFVVFMMVSASGDPLSELRTRNPPPPPRTFQLEAHRLHLDEPLLTRYWHYITGVILHFDLGTSIQYREPVTTLISQRIGVTVDLVLYAAVLIILFGVGLGLLAGLRRGAIDNTVVTVSTVLAAIPSFVAAIVLISVFAVRLGWFPALGSGSGFGDTLKHLTLPAIALAASAVAIVVRVTRVTVRSELGQEHVQTAVSRGIPWRLVVRRHVLRNAAIPITTVLGITITSLFALSAVVEQAFNLNGIGAALVQAALNKDFGVVQGISLLLVGAFVIANAVVDLLYAVLDPRVAVGAKAS